jgi:uncharacterized membrane protein
MQAPIQQIIQITDKAIAGTSTATVGSGLWAFLGTNAQAIGATCALIGVVLTAMAVAVNWYYRHKASKE